MRGLVFSKWPGMLVHNYTSEMYRGMDIYYIATDARFSALKSSVAEV